MTLLIFTFSLVFTQVDMGHLRKSAGTEAASDVFFSQERSNKQNDSLPKCQRESRIINGESCYGFYLAEDKDGKKKYEINTSIGLLDLPFEGMCYTGDFEEVTYIVSALAENTNKKYYEGGMSKVKDLEGISHTENSMIIRVTIFSDYDLELFTDDLILKKCTKQ